MNTVFSNRRAAGRLLASKLAALHAGPDQIILALPRGGVPVAFEIALRLDAPLDVYGVRKLGVPGHEELSMGAVASGGFRVLNQEVIDCFHVSTDVVDAVRAREECELHQREHAYHRNFAPSNLKGRRVILVDDGIATGSTMLAAANGVKAFAPAELVIAAPVAPRSAVRMLRKVADRAVVLSISNGLDSVSEAYLDFNETGDFEVQELLRLAAGREIGGQYGH